MVLPKRAFAGLCKVDSTSRALMWFSTRVKELYYVSKKLGECLAVSPGTAKQCDAIMEKITAKKGLAMIVREASQEREKMVDAVREHVLGRDTTLLSWISQAAVDDAIERKKLVADGRAAAWRANVAKQLTNGAAVTHRWAKRDPIAGEAPDTALVQSKRTASPQAIVDHDLIQWKAIWNRAVDSDAPWRHELVGLIHRSFKWA